jgi:ribosomal protein S20
MPVTKTAKRALRVSTRKLSMNETLKKRMEIAQRKAQKSPNAKNVSEVFSLADRAKKKNLIHKNKAAHIKSAFSKLLSPKTK